MATVSWNPQTGFTSNIQRYVSRAALAGSDVTQQLIVPVGGLKTLLLIPSSGLETGTVTISQYSYATSLYYTSTIYNLNVSQTIALIMNAEALVLTATSLVGNCYADFIWSES